MSAFITGSFFCCTVDHPATGSPTSGDTKPPSKKQAACNTRPRARARIRKTDKMTVVPKLEDPTQTSTKMEALTDDVKLTVRKKRAIQKGSNDGAAATKTTKKGMMMKAESTPGTGNKRSLTKLEPVAARKPPAAHVVRKASLIRQVMDALYPNPPIPLNHTVRPTYCIM